MYHSRVLQLDRPIFRSISNTDPRHYFYHSISASERLENVTNWFLSNHCRNPVALLIHPQ